MEGVSRIRKFVKSNLLTGNMTWTCWDFFYDFFATSFELRAVDRGLLCHLSARPAPPATQSLSHNLRRHRSPRRRPARGFVSYFLVSCVMSIYLSIDLTIFRLAC